jgi:hypothetical protein
MTSMGGDTESRATDVPLWARQCALGVRCAAGVHGALTSAEPDVSGTGWMGCRRCGLGERVCAGGVRGRGRGGGWVGFGGAEGPGGGGVLFGGVPAGRGSGAAVRGSVAPERSNAAGEHNSVAEEPCSVAPLQTNAAEEQRSVAREQSSVAELPRNAAQERRVRYPGSPGDVGGWGGERGGAAAAGVGGGMFLDVGAGGVCAPRGGCSGGGGRNGQGAKGPKGQISAGGGAACRCAPGGGVCPGLPAGALSRRRGERPARFLDACLPPPLPPSAVLRALCVL